MVVVLPFCFRSPVWTRYLYQGVYAGAALKQGGDFGLGTFEGIDGEMTILNGHFYHFRSDGVVTVLCNPNQWQLF